MKTVKYIVLALLIGLGVYTFTTIDRRSDANQIKSIVKSTAEAVEKRDVSGAVSCISSNYKDQYNMNSDRMRMLIVQGLRDEKDLKATAKVTNLKIDGDNARLNVNVTVKGSKNGDVIYKRNIYLTLKKENTKHMLIIPTKIWRVVSADNLGLEMEPGI